MLKKLVLASLVLLFAACQPNLTKDFSFLEGSWKMQTSDSTYLLETWKQDNETHYSALNYVVNDSGKQLSEKIAIDISDSGTYYKPAIMGLNDGNPFMYKFISDNDNKYVFENEAYDFPRRIWYKVIDDNNMQAGIESESGDQKQTFIFERVKE